MAEVVAGLVVMLAALGLVRLVARWLPPGPFREWLDRFGRNADNF